MSKNKNTSILVAVIIGIIGFFVFSQNSAITPSAEQLPALLSENKTSQDQKQELKNSYLPYTQESYEANKDKKRVLFFYANWCSTCKPANQEFFNTTSIPDEVIVFRVNYSDPDTDSEEKQLAKKYFVTYQHTFVQVDKNDAVIATWNGGGLSDLKKKLK